ncbi:MAG: anaerobic ribonucleoside-triphosphate reductase activating protein [Clostridia bacterium]
MGYNKSMVIHGLNKLTLLDYPLHTACTIFTGGCNFRCPFCHNRSLVLAPESQPVISEDEVLSFLKKRVGVLEGACITGGEPTLQPDLFEFCAKVKSLGYKVKLDTNGTNPRLLKKLIDANFLDYVAMDIKNSLTNYGLSVGIEKFNTANIEESVKLLLTNCVDYEFRTTVVKEFNSAEDFREIATWLSGAKKYFLQTFKDSGDLINNTLHAAESNEMHNFLDILSEKIVKVEIRES